MGVPHFKGRDLVKAVRVVRVKKKFFRLLAHNDQITYPQIIFVII